jgi:hypothetical protein
MKEEEKEEKEELGEELRKKQINIRLTTKFQINLSTNG